MTGSRIRIDADGIESVEQRLGALARAGRDLQPLFARIGEYLVASTKQRFRDEKSPDGAPWAPLSRATKARKKKNRDRILTLHGDLGSQIAWRASSAELLVGSDRIYAGTHQFGAKKGQYGTASGIQSRRSFSIPWGDIPARPFLGLSDRDRNAVADMVTDHLARTLA